MVNPALAAASAMFLGAWNLHSIDRTLNGQAIADVTYGDAPAGSLQYSNDGYVSALLQSTTPADRPQNLTLPAQPDQPDSLWALIGRHTIAYSGPFTVESAYTQEEEEGGERVYGGNSGVGMDAENGLLAGNNTMLKGLIVHGNLTTSTLPRFVGTQLKRNYTFSENGHKLQLLADLGNGFLETLVWTKAANRRS